MAFVALSQISGFMQVKGRLSKPFNPLLGETFELVTPDFRMVTEAISHEPPIVALELQGPNYKLFRCAESS